MKERKYHIPDLGHYSVSYFKKQVIQGETIKEGYYGIHGIMTITESCETFEEAETALKNHLYAQIDKKTKQLQLQQNHLNELEKQLAREGVSKFLVKQK